MISTGQLGPSPDESLQSRRGLVPSPPRLHQFDAGDQIIVIIVRDKDTRARGWRFPERTPRSVLNRGERNATAKGVLSDNKGKCTCHENKRKNRQTGVAGVWPDIIVLDRSWQKSEVGHDELVVAWRSYDETGLVRQTSSGSLLGSANKL